MSGRISRYELRVRLGEGTASEVYKAWDPDLERWVALRLIPPGLAGRSEERKPLIREALTVASLEHPNIGPVYDVGEAADGGLFLVSALCEGETLATRLKRGPMRPEVVVAIAVQVAAAVGRAHEHGILHGRLRPSNVWVGGDGQVRVVDFGLAGLEERTWRTWRIEPAGRDFMAPELLLGEAASPRSDVWAVGALLMAMAGRREGLPDDLSRILDRALSSRPADRHTSAGALRDDLRLLRDPSPRPAGRAPGRPPDLSGVRRLSQYRIGDLLGGGGMGVVYRAEDIHLGRTVALKFLPADMAGDPAAKARFLQEARAASALDHPNICTVYEIGETEENQLYLAMPCYEGETLKSRIGRGPLPVSEALDCALQTAKGLAQAHRQGIVHRDVKPANLMLTADGLVKILDFGVAKLAGEATLTRTGAAVGTAAYMAPEQIRGEPVDARADLWSLGVVLYEMVTGRRPFPGDNPEAVRHAVLTREPEPVARLCPEAPPELERVVRGLLGKDPADRYPTADALAAELRILLGRSAVSGSVQVVPVRPPVTRPTIRRRWVAAVVPLLALAGLLWRLPSREAPPPVGIKVTQLTEAQGRELYPSLSPDGSFFVYSKADGGDQDIFLHRVGGRNPINLTQDSPADDTQPVYSPDGKWIAFRSERDGGGLFVMGATGESVRRIADLGYQPAWSPDSREIAFATETVTSPVSRRTTSRLWRAEVQTGRRTLLSESDAVQPSWSPDGKRIAFGGLSSGGTRRALFTVPRGGGGPVTVLDDGFMNWNPAWSPDGRFLYFASDRGGSMNLWRIAVDPDSGQTQGKAEPVPTPAQSVGPFSLSHDGARILYATDDSRADVRRLPVDPVTARLTGEPVPVVRARSFGAVDVSPDGRWLVLNSEVPKEDLFVVRSDGTDLRQITDDPHRDRQARWSPDGEWIYFQSDRSGLFRIWAVRPDGSGLREVVSSTGTHLLNPIPSPDGRSLICSVGYEGTAMVDLTQPPAARKLVPIPMPGWEGFFLNARSWSPDGDWLAGEIGDRKAMAGAGLGLYSFATRRLERLIPAGHGERIIFLDGDRTLLYLDDNSIRAVDRTTRRTWLVATAQPGSNSASLSLSPDRRALYLLEKVSEGDIWMLDLGSRDRAP
ncbi:MAG TPA: protein kinase [Thermoanaerobaculia bacterium]|nr:protein kinase [Thermoanaerobaculia bacterium]